MRECKTCGFIMDASRYSNAVKHIKRCSHSSPSERKYFKRMGNWPKKVQLKPLPPEVPEAPPL